MAPRRPPVITYVAHTSAYSLMLDAEGICRRVVLTKRKAKPSGVDASKAEKCLGAQYVASLDPERPAELVALPRAGAPLLLAKVGKDGRVTLVKTGAVARFDTLDDADDVESSLPSVEVDLSEVLKEDPVDAYADGADRTHRHDRKAVEARLRAVLTARGSGRLPPSLEDDGDDGDDEDDEPPTRQQRLPPSPWSTRPASSTAPSTAPLPAPAPRGSAPRTGRGTSAKRRP